MSLLLIFLFNLLKIFYSYFLKIVYFFINIKENLALLYIKLPGPKKQLSEAKMKIDAEFKKMFSKKFKKIEFYDNKQDYTKILSKMEQNFSGDNNKIQSGKLTGSVYCLNERYIGVVVPKGKHAIGFNYHTPYKTEGFVISLIGIVVFVAFVVYEKLQERNKVRKA